MKTVDINVTISREVACRIAMMIQEEILRVDEISFYQKDKEHFKEELVNLSKSIMDKVQQTF